MNGTLVHGIDYDDTYLPGSIHITASNVPTAIGVASHVGATGKDLLVALAAGLEAAVGVAGEINWDVQRGGRAVAAAQKQKQQ